MARPSQGRKDRYSADPVLDHAARCQGDRLLDTNSGLSVVCPEYVFSFPANRVSLPFRVPSKLTNGRADHKFGGENPLAESHLRMVQSFQKHLHASLANLF